MADGEKLLDITEVRLYGEVVKDMKFMVDDSDDAAVHPTKKFVRVYGYSYDGGYYDLDAPTIMLLDGGAMGGISATTPKDVKDAFPSDIDEWKVDKSKDSIRLDSTAGTIEDILLEAEVHDHMGSVSGGRVSGGRVSGGRVSGGRVSGGRVSGGKSD